MTPQPEAQQPQYADIPGRPTRQRALGPEPSPVPILRPDRSSHVRCCAEMRLMQSPAGAPSVVRPLFEYPKSSVHTTRVGEMLQGSEWDAADQWRRGQPLPDFCFDFNAMIHGLGFPDAVAYNLLCGFVDLSLIHI